jgi:fatty-acyl-CoA synthase
LTPDGVTLLTLLARAETFPDVRIGFLDRGEQVDRRTWAEIAAGARAVAGSLQAAGLEPGQTVALLFPTGFDFLAAFFGTLLAGAVPVPLYPPARLGRLDEYHDRTAAMLRAARARLVLVDPRVKRVIGPSVLGGRPPLGCRTLAELPTGTFTGVSVDSTDLGLVQFSSGTTVDPKPVALSHRALVAQARLLNAYWPDRPGHRHSGVSWLPLYHDMGLIGTVLLALERPGPLTLIPPELFIARPAVWLRTISRERATLSVAPNFAYALCTRKVRDEEMAGVDLSCWEIAINGAETVVPAALRAFAERFARWGFRSEAMTPVYGLSEAALAVTFSDPSRPFSARAFDRAGLAGGHATPRSGGRELTSLGRPLPGFAVAILDDGGAPLPEGTVGGIVVSGPSLMEGYLGQPEATAAVLRDDRLDTGDLGFLLDGELYVTGRAKEVLIVNGQNFAPEELERAVEAVPGTRPGCTVATSCLFDGDDTERVMLLVECARGCSDADRAALPRRCEEAALASVGVRAEVVPLAPDTLPRTSSGKLRRREALRRHLAGELRPPRQVTAALVAGAMARSSLALLRARLAEGDDDT